MDAAAPCLLEEGIGFVAERRKHLRKAVEEEDLEGALRAAVCLSGELRTSRLSPEAYYRLYACVYCELQHLAAFVAEIARQGFDLAPVYESVQSEGNVLPRLYVLITVGVVFAQACSWRADKVLDDLAPLLLAVQHPVRGLFLRYYFLQCMKDLLAQLGADTALRHFLQNFRESVSLWARVRLLDAGGSGTWGFPGTAEAWRLDQKRHMLRFLVCAHMMHIALLPDLTLRLHSDRVLPEVLRLSSICEDAAGQAYLLQCFVEVFPVSFHARTIGRVLSACAQVHWVVDLHGLVRHLLKRLSAYIKQTRPASTQAASGAAAQGQDADEPVDCPDIFGAFYEHARQLHARPRSPAVSLTSLLTLQSELMMAALSLHPDDPERVELVLRSTLELVREEPFGAGRSSELLLDILAAPLTQVALLQAVLAMPYHESMMGMLSGAARRSAALALVAAVHEGEVQLRDCGTLQRLLHLIEPLMSDAGMCGDCRGGGGGAGQQGSGPQEHDSEVFVAEQECVARLAHRVEGERLSEALEMLSALRQRFDGGGPRRQALTLPAVAVATLAQVRRALPGSRSRSASEGAGGGAESGLADAAAAGSHSEASVAELEALVGFAQETLAALRAVDAAAGLRFWLLGVATLAHGILPDSELAEMAAGSVCAGSVFRRLSEICDRASRGFLDAALDCLEAVEHSGRASQATLTGLAMLAGTLRASANLSLACHKAAADRAVVVVARLQSKRLQSKGFVLCAGMFTSPAYHHSGQVVKCLQSAMQCAEGALQIDPADVELFVDILDAAVGVFEGGRGEMTPATVSSLVALCRQHVQHFAPLAPPAATCGLRGVIEDLRRKRDAVGGDPAVEGGGGAACAGTGGEAGAGGEGEAPSAPAPSAGGEAAPAACPEPLSAPPVPYSQLAASVLEPL